MKKLIDAIRESATRHTAEWIATLLVTLLVTLGLALKSEFAEHIWPAISKEWLGRILAGTITLLILETAYIFSLHRQIKVSAKRILELADEISLKLVYYFGVLWSKQAVPHCPACQVPLSFRPSFTYEGDPTPPDPHFYCVKCDKICLLYDETGQLLAPERAKIRVIQMPADNA